MGDIFRFNNKGQKIGITVDEIAREQPYDGEASDNPEEQKRWEEQTAYLTSLTIGEALKTGDEQADGQVMPRNLETMDMSRVRNALNCAIVEKIAWQELVKAEERGGHPLGSDAKRALNNYLQWHDFGTSIVPHVGIAVHDEAWSRRLDRRTKEIRDRKISLVEPLVPAASKLNMTACFSYLRDRWKTSAWQDELRERLAGVSPDRNLMSSRRFLAARRMIGSLSFDGEQPPVDLGKERNMREAEQALARGERVGDIIKPNNPDWNAAGAVERDRKDDVARQRAQITIAFMRGKIIEALRRETIDTAPHDE